MMTDAADVEHTHMSKDDVDIAAAIENDVPRQQKFRYRC